MNYTEAVIVNSLIFDHTHHVTTTDTTFYSTRLTGKGTADSIGLAKSLSVMPGDTLNIEVYAKYLDPNSSKVTLAMTNFIASLAAGGGAPAGTIIDGGYPGSLGNNTFPFAGMMNYAGADNSVPKAYLNYLIFDRNYTYRDGGFRQVSIAAKEDGQDTTHELLSFNNIIIKEPGYVYIWLSNENATPVEVFFDDLKVTLGKSAVVQMDDYYPFGATFNSYGRENSLVNTNKYQNKNYQEDLGVNLYDFNWRQYDPWIARTTTMDPHASNYFSYSPYSFCLDNPVIFRDPNGKDVIFDITRDKKTGQISGVTVRSTVIITGEGANEERADNLNKDAGNVFQSKKVNGVKISFDIKYKYSKDVKSGDLKQGENVLNFVSKVSTRDDRSHVTGFSADPSNPKATARTGRFGEIYKDEWDNTGTIYHESLHFTGLSDQYFEHGKPDGEDNPVPGFENDIMGVRGSKKIGYDHYDSYYKAATNPAMLKQYPNGYLNRGFVDVNAGGYPLPASKTQQDEQ